MTSIPNEDALMAVVEAARAVMPILDMALGPSWNRAVRITDLRNALANLDRKSS